MNHLKKFIFKTAFAASPIFLFIGIAVLGAYSADFDKQGDLAPLGKIEFGQDYYNQLAQPQFTDSCYHDFTTDNDTASVLIVGDSFARLGINGFQNYLGHALNRNIATLSSFGSPVEEVITLFNTGYFEKHPTVKWLIIESVERLFVERYSNLQFDKTSLDKPNKHETSVESPIRAFISGLNSYIGWGMGYMRARLSPIKTVVPYYKLKKDCFSHETKGNELFHFWEDCKIAEASPSTMITLRQNISKISDLGSQHGVTVIFFIAPDKFDVYKDHIDNTFVPSKPLTEQLLSLHTEGKVIFPIIEFKSHIEKETKDLYFCSDSHWTYKGASIASDLITQKMNEVVLHNN